MRTMCAIVAVVGMFIAGGEYQSQMAQLIGAMSGSALAGGGLILLALNA